MLMSTQQSGDTALHVAAEAGFEAIVIMLLMGGASPHTRNNVRLLLCALWKITLRYIQAGQSPHDIAVMKQHQSIANMLM